MNLEAPKAYSLNLSCSMGYCTSIHAQVFVSATFGSLHWDRFSEERVRKDPEDHILNGYCSKSILAEPLGGCGPTANSIWADSPRLDSSRSLNPHHQSLRRLCLWRLWRKERRWWRHTSSGHASQELWA